MENLSVFQKMTAILLSVFLFAMMLFGLGVPGRVVSAMEGIRAEVPEPTEGTFPGDLEINGNTYNEPYETDKNAEIDLTGVLGVQRIKEQINVIKESFPDVPPESISLSDLSSTFTAKITLPGGLKYHPEILNEWNVNFTGGNAIFDVDSVSMEGTKTAIVKLKLQDTENIKNFGQLRGKIHFFDDELKVTVKSAYLEDSATPGAEYVVIGSLEGEMQATATVFGQEKKFAFKWTAQQTASGADTLHPNNIALRVKEKTIPETSSESSAVPTTTPTSGSTQESQVVIPHPSEQHPSEQPHGTWTTGPLMTMPGAPQASEQQPAATTINPAEMLPRTGEESRDRFTALAGMTALVLAALSLTLRKRR